MIVRGFSVTLKIYSDSVMMSLSCVKMILSLVAQMLYSRIYSEAGNNNFMMSSMISVRCSDRLSPIQAQPTLLASWVTFH